MTEEPVEEVKNMTQVWRSAVPNAGPARQINLGEYSVETMDNGLTLIVVENHKLPRVSYQLSLRNKPGKEGEEVGFKSIAGDLIGRGTTTMSKSEIDAKVDYVGADFNTFATGMFGSSLTKHQETVLSVMSDVLMNANFPKEEFDKIKTQSLSGIETTKTDPNSIASNVAATVNYGGNHPYGEITTAETLNKVNIKTCKDYFNTYFKPNNAYLTIVGDITPSQAKANAMKYFGSWKKGDVPTHDYKSPERPSQAKVAIANKDGAVQSVINVTYPVDLMPGSQEALQASLTNAILGGGGFMGRLMQNLREDKAFTYGARSSLRADEVVGSFNASASVRTEVTDSSIVEFLYEMNRMGNEPVPEKDLQKAKNSLSGSFARSLESPQSLARYARNIVRYNLPEDHYATYLERLDAVTVADVQAIAKKYITADNANIVVVGNKDDISEKLMAFDGDGEIDYYDPFGKKMENIQSELPSDVNADVVINDYLSACGGMEKLKMVKTLETHYAMSIMGQDATVNTYHKAPNKMALKVGTDQMVFQEEKFDGTTAFSGGMAGNSKTTEGPAFEQTKGRAVMFKQIAYLTDAYDLELKGIDNVDGEPCYKINVTNSAGEKTTEFYSVKSNLLIKEVMSQPGPGGQSVTITQEFEDYKKINGIPMPHKITTSGAMPMPMVMNATSIVVDGDIDDAIFMIK